MAAANVRGLVTFLVVASMLFSVVSPAMAARWDWDNVNLADKVVGAGVTIVTGIIMHDIIAVHQDKPTITGKVVHRALNTLMHIGLAVSP